MSARCPRWTLSTRICGLNTSTKPSATSSSCVAKSITASVIERRAASWTPTMLRMTSATITIDAADDVPGVLAQRPPEDREVVGDEERRRRDGDDVDEHLRPGGAERDELVERVPGEAGRAAGLREADRPLGVRRRGGREDHARRRRRRSASARARRPPSGRARSRSRSRRSRTRWRRARAYRERARARPAVCVGWAPQHSTSHGTPT